MNEKEVEGYIFPLDDIPTLSGGTSDNFRRLMKEVADCFEIEFYRVENRPYLKVVNFDRHQRTERKAQGRHPGPEMADEGRVTNDYSAFVGESDTVRRSAKEVPTLSEGSSECGTGEQGNRGTGEQGNSVMRIADAKRDAKPATTPPHGFEEFWSRFPNRKGKQKAIEAFREALKRADLETILQGADNYAIEAREILRRNPNATLKYPQGWLNDNRWEDEPTPTFQAPSRSEEWLTAGMHLTGTDHHQIEGNWT